MEKWIRKERTSRWYVALLAMLLMCHMISPAATAEHTTVEITSAEYGWPCDYTTYEGADGYMYTTISMEPVCDHDADALAVDNGQMEQAEVAAEPTMPVYTIPEEYSRAGGAFPEEIQQYTYNLCQQYGIPYALILAMIETESGYRESCVGDDGRSSGYMQIMSKWHKERMARLGVSDMTDGKSNIAVGVDYIAELIGQYGTIQDALAVYNYGPSGAKKHLWNKGIYVYSYNRKIMARMAEIEAGWE